MTLFFKRRSIDLGSMPQQYGHVVYRHATYRKKFGDAIPIIYKENKQADPKLSRFEVAFGELAQLFLAPYLTPPLVLVKDEEEDIVGVACEHISYTIARRQLLPNVFYQLEEAAEEPQLSAVDVSDTADIPYYFLSEFPSGFFNTLSRSAERGHISLDMESLAQVLTTSYSLEEDDLHKGNLGFYVVRKNSKPHVVFFKIDHDLMLADSVISHCHSRFTSWLRGAGAFEITKRDLVHFPRLTDSQNYYWPTVKRPILGVGSKAYTSDVEVNAFAALATSKEFCRIKWLAFYKHVLIPPAFIEQSLSKHLDNNDPDDRAYIALITQSVVLRQAKLRAVLFSIPEFRDVVCSLDDSDRASMLQSIIQPSEREKVDGLETQIVTSMMRHKELCQPDGGFVLDDTPLHAAIRLQDYRYEDTWQSFGHFVNQKNHQGKTPLDVAVSMASLPQRVSADIRGDSLCTMKHLLREGAKKTADYQQFTGNTHLNLNNYLFHSGYSTRARQVETVLQLKQLLRDLGEDHRYSLKMKKELAVICVRQFTNTHKNNAHLGTMLAELKADLNGSADIPPAPELQFIRQLRSQLWIVRIIRGLLGGTATQVQLNHFIDNELKRLTPPTPSCWSFFATQQRLRRDEPGPTLPQEGLNRLLL